MIEQQWIDDIDKLLNSKDKFTVKEIKKMLAVKYGRNFGSIVIENMLAVLKNKYIYNKVLLIKMLNVRSNR